MVEDLHAPRASLERRLEVAILIAVAAAVLEIAGSWLSNSLALLSDAGHVGTDAVGLGLAVWALRLSRRPHTARMSFGYHRMEVLAALANALLLVGVAVFLGIEAFGRYLHPSPVEGGIMLVVGAAGLAANLAMLALLREWARRNINARGAFLHAFGDTLGSVGVVSGAVLIQVTGIVEFDLAISLLIVALIAIGAARLVRDGVRVILEESPADVDPAEVAAAIEAVPGVLGIHDLHVWTVTTGHVVLTGHIRVWGNTTVQEASRLVERTNALLRDRFGIAHVTLQVDSVQDEMISASEVDRGRRT